MAVLWLLPVIYRNLNLKVDELRYNKDISASGSKR